MLELNKIYFENCYHTMKDIDDKSIDLILTDPPYNTTANSWDVKINLPLLWEEYNRIIKDNGAIIMTSCQPFTTTLIMSNKSMFKYILVWDKVNPVGFLLANKRPMPRHEDICIFYKNMPTYNPQMEIRGFPRKKGGSSKDKGCYGGVTPTTSFNNEYFPTSILKFSGANQADKIHTTQKPVELFSYLIKTYSNKNDLILDTFSGSGTTAIACLDTERNYICFEKEKEYFDKSSDRVLQWHQSRKTIFDMM